MALHRRIVEHLVRLSIPVPEDQTASAIDLLIHDIEWPKAMFDFSIERLRAHLIANGADAAGWHDDDITDRAPFYIVDLQFSSGGSPLRGQLHPGWESDLSGTDTSVYVPFAIAMTDYYFLSDQGDPTDPPVSAVLEGEWDQAPTQTGMTVSELLGWLG